MTNEGESALKKRILSGLLAAVMLIGTAYAAPGSASAAGQTAAVAAEQAQTGTVLTYTVTLPEGTDRMDDAAAEQMRAALERRLEQLNIAGAEIAFPADGTTVTVTLPAADAAADVGAFLARVNALRITDTAGETVLTGADVAETEAGLNADDTYHVQLSFTDAAQEKLAALAQESGEDAVLTVTMDGEDAGSLTLAQAMEQTCTLTGPFTGDEARQLVARIVGGELPAALTLTETTTEPSEPSEPTEPTDPSEPEQPSEPEEPVTPVFPDIAGHWAEDALNTGVEMGLLNGVDGRMLPDNPVKRSEAVVILNRALGASVADSISGLNSSSQNVWYSEDLGKGIHLGLIDADDSRNFNTAATRAEAFVLIARAFVFDRAESAADELSAFTDTGSMTEEQLQAAAALAAEGIINGTSDTTLSPDGQLTRAAFVTMVTRVADQIIGEETAPAEEPAADEETAPAEETTTDSETTPDAETAPEEETTTDDTASSGSETVPDSGSAEEEQSAQQIRGGSIIVLPESEVANTTITGDLIYGAQAADIRMDAVTANDRVVIKGAEQTALSAENGTEISTLAIDPAGTAQIDLATGTSAGTVVIAGKGGKVTFDGAADNIEITASGRTIELDGMQAAELTVTGSNNTIIVNGSAGSISINGGAKNNTLTLNGSADSLLVAGVGSKVDGSGKAGTVDIRAVDCNVTVSADSVVENIDKGLSGISIRMGVPTKVLPGGSLLTQAAIDGVTEEKICSAQWYQDGKPIAGYGNDHFVLTPGVYSRITTTFTFTKDMQTSVTMGFKLTYENPSTGETEELYEEATVPIENYSDEWYYERDVNRVLNLVSSTYRGNYTTSYAVNGDYSQTEKEIWINAKGYSSNTQYLLWINRAYQHVNVFQGSKGNWKMIKSFLVGTGAASTPTPTGLTTVSYKSAAGWTTGTYTVRPVVGFYPGTGYAFHSRLCYPGTDTEYDFSAGYPVSHGCVRMYKSDINWIYNNIPVGTAVVIF